MTNKQNSTHWGVKSSHMRLSFDSEATTTSIHTLTHTFAERTKSVTHSTAHHSTESHSHNTELHHSRASTGLFWLFIRARLLCACVCLACIAYASVGIYTSVCNAFGLSQYEVMNLFPFCFDVPAAAAPIQANSSLSVSIRLLSLYMWINSKSFESLRSNLIECWAVTLINTIQL